MAYLNKLNLRAKLLLMLLIPITALALFVIYESLSTSKLLHETEKVKSLAELSVKTSALVHELQKERGLSAGYLGSKGKKFVAELPVQRKLTDSKSAILLDYLQLQQTDFGSEFETIKTSALNDLSNLSETRKKISTQQIPLKQAIAYFTNMNKVFIDLITVLPKQSSLGDINNTSSSYVNFILSKERAGIERAVLAGTFSADSFAPGMYNKLQTLVTEQATYFNVFKSLATSSQKIDFNSLFDLKAFKETASMRKIAIDRHSTGGFDIDPKYWFDMQTEKINHLKSFEDQLSENLLMQTVTINESATRSLYSTILASIFSIIAGILVSWIIARTILTQLGSDPDKLRKLTEEIANGNLDVNFSNGKKKCIGVLASMHTMRNNLRDRIEQERLSAAENHRVKQALDNVNANVMIADREHNIAYVNPSLLNFLQQSESNIRQSISGFSTDTILDSNLGVFYEGGNTLLNNLNGTQKTDRQFSNSHIRLYASPIIDENGEHLGTVVEWVDRYQESVVQKEMQTIIQSALSGELDTRINLADKNGFIKQLSEGINQLLAVFDQVVDDTVNVLSAMSQGDLTRRIQTEYEGSFARLRDDVHATIDKLTEVTGEIGTSAHLVLNGSQEIAQGNTNLSQRTEQQASNLEQTASSMEQMTSTVRQNADNATQANQLASNTRTQAEQGGHVVDSAITAMKEITDSSNKIAAIISVIDEIAFQTNLLALNAAVEAARAGEQGRGFAVVASEVRNLAGRSATAAKEIKTLIEDSVDKVEEGSKLVDASGKTLEEIMASVKKVSDIIAEIAAASQEQSDGIEQVNKAISQMDEMTQQNAALVEEAAAASESMGEQAHNLNEMIGFFTTNGSMNTRPAVERRTESRPWSGNAATASSGTTVTPQKAVNAESSDWEEF